MQWRSLHASPPPVVALAILMPIFCQLFDGGLSYSRSPYDSTVEAFVDESEMLVYRRLSNRSHQVDLKYPGNVKTVQH